MARMLQYLVCYFRDAQRRATVNSDCATGSNYASNSEAIQTPTTENSQVRPDVPVVATESATELRRLQSQLLLGLLPLIWVVTGCACLRSDKVDKNVVSARQLSLRGIDAIQRGRWDEAESLFASALKKNPADERAHRHFAEVLSKRGQHQAAIQHLEESARLSGGDPNLLVQLGARYLALGNEAAATECAEEAIQGSGQLAGAWALRGDIHRRRNEPDRAMECFHRALSYQPQYPDVQLALADIYRQQDRPRRALSTLEALVGQYRPEEIPAELLHQRGLALKSLGRHQDAVESLTLASHQGEPTVEILFHLSEAQHLAGNNASARLALQAALARAPNHAASLKLSEKIDRQTQAMTASVKRP